MIELQAFEEADFKRFISWIQSEEELVQFAGPAFNYPITAEQLSTYICDKRRKPYKICNVESGEIIGHCELNFQNPVPRLSRILIADPSYRNKGIGQKVVRIMLDIIFSSTSYNFVDLSVFDWNENAITCYQRIGFKITPDSETQMQVGSQTWKAFSMVLSREEYLHHAAAIPY